MQTLHENIAQLAQEVAALPVSDLLVHVDKEQTAVYPIERQSSETFTLPTDSRLNRILSKTKSIQKETDVSALCLAYGSLTWTYKDQLCSTPIFLRSLTFGTLPLQKDWRFEPNEEVHLNPFLAYFFEKNNWSFGNSTFSDLDSAFAQFKHWNDQYGTQLTWDEDWSVLGNFHIHRFSILRELEQIMAVPTNESLQRLFGLEHASLPSLDLPFGYITWADPDQKEAIRLLGENDVAVQGPPGTGKSQVIVNTIGKLLGMQQSTLVVAEKKVALEVIEQKLRDLSLDVLAFRIDQQTSATDFVKRLQQNWDIMETGTIRPKVHIARSEPLYKGLQQILDRLHASDTLSGISYSEFQHLLLETPLDETIQTFDVPSCAEWLMVKDTVRDLPFSFQPLAHVLPTLFQLPDPLKTLDEMEERIHHICETFQIETKQQLDQLYHSLGRAQLLENESVRTYWKLLSKSREIKRVQEVVNEIKSLDEQIHLWEEEGQLWTQPPSISELDTYKMDISWWKRKQLQRQLKKRLINPAVDLEEALENWDERNQLLAERISLMKQLRIHELPENMAELEVLLNLFRSILKDDSSLLKHLLDQGQDFRKKLLNERSSIETIRVFGQQFLQLTTTSHLKLVISDVKQLIVSHAAYIQTLSELPIGLYKLFHQADDWRRLQTIICSANWKKIQLLFPELAKFRPERLLTYLEELLNEKRFEQQYIREELLYQLTQRFHRYHLLILKDSQKCSPEEKELRHILKQGKRLLVKEFAKTRSHKSIRQLLESEARLWIESLVPVWLTTPQQLANNYPMHANLFDLLIMDEASQIPLSSAVGAIYRSKRMMIVGDEQQMAPTSYFGSHFAGHDVLHQANYYLPSTMLKHHYRSLNSDLIAFSNHYFYDNQLTVFPAANKTDGVKGFYISDGKYIDRKNTAEANALAKSLEQANWNDKIGIVAFSEEQLNCILSACSENVRQKITNGLENDTVFFKALENVQGDEADNVYISIGYGFNEQGEFPMRFGPLNRQNGHKRLNVLATRARKACYWFYSFHPQDMGASANSAVLLLKQLIARIENAQETTIHVNNDVLTWSLGNLPSNDAKELLNQYILYSQRGWKIQVTH